jgi:hypothetical protein
VDPAVPFRGFPGRREPLRLDADREHGP